MILKEFDIVRVLKDLKSFGETVHKGAVGVIVQVLDKNVVLVEFRFPATVIEIKTENLELAV